MLAKASRSVGTVRGRVVVLMLSLERKRRGSAELSEALRAEGLEVRGRSLSQIARAASL